jgi:hypothetical protein
MASNAVPPSVTPPSPFEWPETVRTITNITNAAQAEVTSALHGFTSADVGITSIMFKQVLGMIQINGQPGVVQAIIDDNNFTVNINSTNYFTYTSGGVYIIDTGIPPSQTVGFQTFNTPFQNIARSYY